jgi:endonuclease-3 related protein
MEKPKFVVDAYTLKILKCLGIDGNYDTIQALFEKNLPSDVKLFKHYHALIVEFGKRYCNKNRCNECEILTLKN